MENFIVSARKYRPQTFDTVVGQPSITNTLKNAIRNNQLAQAFLFCGPRGVGKTTCARILAKTINCERISDRLEACDECTSCVSFNENASFNIYELDGASNNSVDGIRALIDQVRIPPQAGKYKVYIIDEVHMLSASAFNAFLKTLEEPPPYAKFILATTEKHKILPTILSRCQIFDFKRITVEDIAGHLAHVAQSEHVTAEENALHIIAQKADGAMRDALSIFDQLVSFAGTTLTYQTVLENLNVLDYDYYFRVTGQILQGEIKGTLLTINDIIDKGFEGQHFLVGFGEHLRNLLVCKDPATAILMETAPSIRGRYLEQSALCPANLLLHLLDLHNRCDLNYKNSNNKRLHLELALMQMCQAAVPASPSAVPVPPPAAIAASRPVTTTPTPTPAPSSPAKPAIPTAASAPPATASAEKPEEKPVEKPAERPADRVRMKDIGPITTETSLKNPPRNAGSQQTDGNEPDENGAASPFTQEELYLQWDAFAESIKNSSAPLYAALKNARPVIREGFELEFTVGNKVVEDELILRKTELLLFLRGKLNNSRIRVATRVAEVAANLRPYTDKEKFELMAGKNPALRDLREELDLEIEY